MLPAHKAEAPRASISQTRQTNGYDGAPLAAHDGASHGDCSACSISGFGSARPAKKPLVYAYYLVGVPLVTQFVSSGTQAYTAGVFLRPMTEDLDWTRGDYTLAQTVGRFLMAGVGFFVGTHVDEGRARGLMVIGGTVLGCGLLLVSAIHPVTIFGLEIPALAQWIVLKGLLFTIGAALIGNLVVNVTLSNGG